MAYRYRYYTPFEQRQKREKIAKRLRRIFLLVLALLLLLSLAVSVSERLGGPLPTWNDLYAAAGLVQKMQLPQEAKAAETKVYFMDVGQGDAVLLESGGEYCLIDTGPESARSVLLHELKAAGVSKLRLLVLTHAHTDHVGNAAAILNTFAVEQVLLPDAENTPEASQTVLVALEAAVQQSGASPHTGRTGAQYALGDGVLTVLCGGIEDGDCNDSSLVLRFDAPDFSYLATGDAGKNELNALLESNQPMRAALLKAGHHGASAANPPALLKAVQPKTVVVSCGLNNDFGHPQKQALEAFAAVGAQVCRTDWNGCVVAYSRAGGAPGVVLAQQGTAESPAASLAA